MRIMELNALEEKIKLYDPKAKQKEGWAEVLMEGKRVDLASIKKEDKFIITDTKTKLKVLCLEKEEL